MTKSEYSENERDNFLSLGVYFRLFDNLLFHLTGKLLMEICLEFSKFDNSCLFILGDILVVHHSHKDWKRE